jgi:2-polyprenyl-3-methyl-5-hydroxy-6-metoxy-1,4-benzoquinol methylase
VHAIVDPKDRRVAFSCVVDAKPKFEWQAFLWAHSLVRNGCCDPRDLRVHCLPGVTQNFRRTVGSLGVSLVEIEPFDGHAYCNKIQQCFSGAFEGYDTVVLTDCDLFFVDRPELPREGTFAGKVVDVPNPPLEDLRAIYDAAGVPLPGTVPVDCALSASEATYRTNLNGGFYVVDAAILPALGTRWKERALWLLDRLAMLGSHTAHVDQVAMSLALYDLGIEVTPLTARTNFPAHLPVERLRTLNVPSIDVLHYHSHVLPGGQLGTTGLANIDTVIARANASIEAIIGENMDNLLFWNWRYACFPHLGSGVGSRGETLEYKKQLLAGAVRPFREKAVLDVGCGDLETSKALDLRDYQGMDVSAAALEIAQSKRPDWRFTQGNLADETAAPRADLVLCLDVLIHQKRREEYEGLVSALISSARERLIVSGYERPPTHRSNIVGFHEPLSTTLRKSGAFSEVFEIGSYRDVSVIVADKRPTGPARHRNDITPAVLDAMLPMVARPDLLLETMDTSRQHLGFFTQTAIRAIEYPWIIEKLAGSAAGARVLDIGSGVSPIPLMLADRGLRVDCVDAHPTVMSLEQRMTWNEWGFLDYAQLNPKIRSFHTDILAFAPTEPYDAIYSISVVEHMPRTIWERTLQLAASWLKPSGALFLTVDVTPGTHKLWNLSEGKIVDQVDNHGAVEDLGVTLIRSGLRLDEAFLRENIPHSRTDVGFFVARRA